jgi:anthranilate phosphoribosyltransferase
MKFVAPARRELKRKTIFNHVGPLTNPANPSRMVVGVYEQELGETMASALIASGVSSGIVVCGFQGLDEVWFDLTVRFRATEILMYGLFLQVTDLLFILQSIHLTLD